MPVGCPTWKRGSKGMRQRSAAVLSSCPTETRGLRHCRCLATWLKSNISIISGSAWFIMASSWWIMVHGSSSFLIYLSIRTVHAFPAKHPIHQSSDESRQVTGILCRIANRRKARGLSLGRYDTSGGTYSCRQASITQRVPHSLMWLRIQKEGTLVNIQKCTKS